MLMASSVLLFELPLSVLAALGVTEFGRFGPIRYLWSIAAIGFHFGILLLMRPKYDVQAWIVIVLILEVPTKLLAKTGFLSVPECLGSRVSRSFATRAFQQRIKLLIAIISTLVVFAWTYVGVAFHHVDNDPNWPITSTPMYSTLFFLDPSVRMYSKLVVVDAGAEGMANLTRKTRSMVLSDLRPLNSTVLEFMLATNAFDQDGSLIAADAMAGNLTLYGMELHDHRCYSSHWTLPDGVALGVVAESDYSWMSWGATGKGLAWPWA